MKFDFVELIQKVRKPKDEKFRNQLYVFLICLGISVVIWFLIVLSKESATTINYPIIYENPPDELILVNKPDSILSFMVSSGVFKLITLKHLTRKKPVEIDLSKLNLKKEGSFYTSTFPTSGISGSIIIKLNLSDEIISISPQNIYFKFETLSGKKVRVIPRLKLDFKKQYRLSDSLKATPDSIMIIGPKNEIVDISFVETVPEEINKIDKSQTMKAVLSVPSGKPNIKLMPDQVEIFVPVDKYTESYVEIPISFKDNKGLKLKTFPDKVKITYLVALKDFNRVDPDMFSASVNFDNKQKQEKLEVVIVHYPAYIKITKVEPDEVEYLVLKQ